MKEAAETSARIKLVIYSSFGRGDEHENRVTGADIGRYVAYLLSDQGAGVRGETIHLRSPEAVSPTILAGQGDPVRAKCAS